MGLFSLSDKFASFGSTAVDNQFLLEFMPNATGDQVKVYLYGLMACTCQMADMAIPQIAHDLGLTADAVMSAYRHWERVGLVERTGDNPVSFRYLPPNASIFTGSVPPVDRSYESFTDSVLAIFGTDYRLHGKRIIQFYEWVTELKLPEEVVLMLIRHMISIHGKEFSFQTADKLAAELAREGVHTIEDAETALTRNRKALETSRAVLRRLNLRREPTEPELEMCTKWMQEWTYTPEAILAACDQTTAAVTPSFKYLDGILEKRRSAPGKSVSGPAFEKKVAEDEQRREPLRKVYEALGRGANAINAGSLQVYWQLRQTFDDPEVIQYAATLCGKANGRLEDVVTMVTSWKKRGIVDKAGAEAYVNSFNDEKRLLTELGEIWGIRAPSGEVNHKLIRKWRDGGMPDEVTLYVSRQMHVDGKHMPYLDAILTSYLKTGILTVAAAEEEMTRHRQNAAGGAKSKPGGVRQVTENQYQQRENTENTADDIPQWLLDRQKEMEERAKRDSGAAADGV